MVITQSNGKSIMWYVAHVPPSSNTFSLSYSLSPSEVLTLNFTAYTLGGMCYYYFYKGEHWFSFSFHQIFILSPWLSLFCGHSHYSFWRCVVDVVAWSWFHALWLFSFNWNSRHFHASKKIIIDKFIHHRISLDWFLVIEKRFNSLKC